MMIDYKASDHWSPNDSDWLKALVSSLDRRHGVSTVLPLVIIVTEMAEWVQLASGVDAWKSRLNRTSLVTALLAHIQALAGNAHEFHATIAAARSMMETPEAIETRPAWLYWFDMTESLTRHGHGLLALAHAETKPLAHQANKLLTPKSSVTDSGLAREAVYNRFSGQRGPACGERSLVGQRVDS